MSSIERLRMIKRYFDKADDILRVDFLFPNDVKIIAFAKTESGQEVPLNARVGDRDTREIYPDDYELGHKIDLVVTVEEDFTLELHAYDSSGKETQVIALDEKQAGTRNIVWIIENISKSPAKSKKFSAFTKEYDVAIEIRIEGKYPLYADCCEIVIGNGNETQPVPEITLENPYKTDFYAVKGEVFVKVKPESDYQENIPEGISVVYVKKN